MQKELVDFSDCEASINKYDGAVYKHPIMYRGERYILKYGEALSRLRGNHHMPTTTMFNADVHAAHESW